MFSTTGRGRRIKSMSNIGMFFNVLYHPVISLYFGIILTIFHQVHLLVSCRCCRIIWQLRWEVVPLLFHTQSTLFFSLLLQKNGNDSSRIGINSSGFCQFLFLTSMRPRMFMMFFKVKQVQMAILPLFRCSLLFYWPQLQGARSRTICSFSMHWG